MKPLLPIMMLIFLSSINCIGQKGTISGRLVSMSDSIPQYNVMVYCSGETYGKRTDSLGYFEFKKKRGESVDLRIEYNLLTSSMNYMTIQIKNISLSKEYPNFNIGTIPMVDRNEVEEIKNLPYIEVNGNKYWYSIAGIQENIIMQYLVVDASKPNMQIENDLVEMSIVINNTAPSVTDYRYPGGTDALRMYIKYQLKYPKYAVQRGIVGLAVVSCVLNPDGSIHEISMLNPIDPVLDEMVMDILRSTDGMWKKTDINTKVTFYAQIQFELADIPFYYYELSTENLVEKVGVTAKKYSMSTTNYNGRTEIHTTEPEDFSFISKRRTDEYITDAIATALSDQNYKKALKHLNEAIRRNPYEPNLYQLRIMVNSKLGDKEKVIEDVQKTGDFMNGMSLQNIIDGY